MKKYAILFFTMLFFAGFALAQDNASRVTQNDRQHLATVDQIGGSNLSLVMQSNAENKATVYQYNERFEGHDMIQSTVSQTGFKNLAIVKQEHDRKGAYPGPGGLLEAVIDQSGDRNLARQLQGPAYNGSNSQMGTSLASITQVGDDNRAFQEQYKYWNTAGIFQSGNNNFAKQVQDGDLPEVGSANFADINQSGNWNEARQYQNGWGNSAIADQGGNFNNAFQLQDAWKSIAYIVQSADGNRNLARQIQNGALNDASIEQYSNGNVALQDQSATVPRSSGYTPLNFGKICQGAGANNWAKQTQTTPGGDIDANYAITNQVGANNWAKTTQWNGFNNSIVTQTGNANHADVTQNEDAF